MSMSNEDAQLLQTRQFQRQEICGIYGVPPHMISDTAQAKGWSTMEQMMTEFVTLSLNPIAIRFEQAIARAFIPVKDRGTRYAKFATTGLLRGDSAARAAFYRSGIDGGWLTPNEARKYEDLNPLPGGDTIQRVNTTAAPAKETEDEPPKTAS
jgi:HK97 family phage portal protein